MFRFQPVRLVAVRWILAAGLMLAIAGQALASQATDIYHVNTLVKSQATAERDAAARATLGEVIVRVSGQRATLNHPMVRQAIANAQNYLFGFTYNSASEKLLEGGKTFPAIGLQLNYAPAAIERLLREAQLPVWPAQRPTVLVLLVAKDRAGLAVLANPASLVALQAQARYRGLPVVLPEGNLPLTAGDLWSANRATIQAAARLYQADAILLGRMTPSALGPIPSPTDAAGTNVAMAMASAPLNENQGPWLGDWHLFHAANDQHFTDETPAIGGLVESAIDRAADYFASQYAIMPGGQGPQVRMLHIGNIASFNAFKQVQAYLDSLAIVQRMDILQVKSEDLLVRLTLEGDAKLLVSTLALGKKLVPAAASDIAAESSSAENSATVGAGTVENPLQYLWQQ